MVDGNATPVSGRSHRLIICALYGAVVVVLSLVPARTLEMIPGTLPGMDKAGHFVMYGVYAWLILWAVRSRAGSGWSAVKGAVLFCAVYGLAMECLQALLPGDRSFSAWDIAANLLGATVFAAIRMRTRIS